MIRRRMALIASAAVAVVGISACSQGGGTATPTQNAAPKEFTFIAAEYSSNTQPYWQDLVTRFEGKNPGVTVHLQVINWNDINQKVNTLVATNQAPDLLNIDVFSGYAKDDLLANAKDYIPSSTLTQFPEKILKTGEVNGVQVVVPLLADVRALFYNKAIFAAAHIANPPTTWAELRADALKIKALGYIGYGLPLGPEEAHGEFSLWLFGAGGSWKTNDKWTINSPQALTALNEMKNLAVVDKVTEVNPGTTNRDDLIKVFGEGKVGMMAGGTFLPGIVHSQNPKIEIGSTPIPVQVAGTPSSTINASDYMMAFKTAKNLPLIGQFLAFFYQTENYVKFLSIEGFVPATISAQSAMKNDPLIGPFIPQVDTAKYYPTTDPAWAAVQAQAMQQLGTVLQGQASPKSVLDALQQTALRGK